MPKLSLIIPCYNCESTLQAAVESVYRQEPAVPFDVTLVDDGSSDGTYQIMESLASRFPDMELVRHLTNRGGGAARNTAVAHSDGDLIFCLDSDDMLGPDFLRNMTRFWVEQRCDGLGISKSIKFRKDDIRDVAYITEFEGPGNEVRFESLFDSSACSLFSTFLITRRAFEYIGGYPTSHGFDTQGMAFRFLCNGLRAFTCPEAVYYHRVHHSQSYFLREAGAGRTHWNWFKIFEEFMYLFKDEVKAKILDHEYFPSGPRPTLESEIGGLLRKEQIFAEAFDELLRLGRSRVASRLAASANMYDQYWVGAYHLMAGRHAKALEHFVFALNAGFNHRIIYGGLLEAALQVSGNTAPARLSIRDLTYHVNQVGPQAESSAPPLSRYQRFENALLRYRGISVLGSILKGLRKVLRTFAVKPVPRG